MVEWVELDIDFTDGEEDGMAHEFDHARVCDDGICVQNGALVIWFSSVNTEFLINKLIISISKEYIWHDISKLYFIVQMGKKNIYIVSRLFIVFFDVFNPLTL